MLHDLQKYETPPFVWLIDWLGRADVPASLTMQCTSASDSACAAATTATTRTETGTAAQASTAVSDVAEGSDVQHTPESHADTGPAATRAAEATRSVCCLLPLPAGN
jgi:hypothetical protein